MSANKMTANKMTANKMTANKMTVNEMTVNEMTVVNEITVNEMTVNEIPYIVFDDSHSGSSIMRGSALKEDLYNKLVLELKIYMKHHGFLDLEKEDDELKEEEANFEEIDFECESEVAEADFECDDCGCQVVAKIYITVTPDGKFCGACNPNLDIEIDKKMFDKFMKFIDNKNESCEISYFENNVWHKFEIE